MKIVVVIPTYNERGTLPILIKELVNELERAVEKFSIIIMDDASPDGTGQIAEELNAKYGNIIVVHRKTKFGLGSAYKEGFKLALEKFKPDCIVQMDADFSHDPKEISAMVEKVADFDFGIASRHVIGSRIIGWNHTRKIVHSTAGLIASFCGGLKTSDPTSGYRIFKRYVLGSLNFDDIRSSGFSFQIEILCHLKKLGFRGIDFPTTFVNRKEGKSKMGIKEVVQFVRTCLFLLLNRGHFSSGKATRFYAGSSMTKSG